MVLGQRGAKFCRHVDNFTPKTWDDKLPKVSLRSVPDDNSIDLLEYLATLAG